MSAFSKKGADQVFGLWRSKGKNLHECVHFCNSRLDTKPKADYCNIKYLLTWKTYSTREGSCIDGTSARILTECYLLRLALAMPSPMAPDLRYQGIIAAYILFATCTFRQFRVCIQAVKSRPCLSLSQSLAFLLPKRHRLSWP